MENRGEYEQRVEDLLEQCDAQIAQFRADSEQAGPEQRAKYDEEISLLIANREALRRGLLRVSLEGEDLCSACSEDKSVKERASDST